MWQNAAAYPLSTSANSSLRMSSLDGTATEMGYPDIHLQYNSTEETFKLFEKVVKSLGFQINVLEE